MTGVYSFGSRSLDDIDAAGKYLVFECDPPATPVALLEYPLGRYEGSLVADWNYGENVAGIGVAVMGDDKADTEAALDLLLRDLYRGRQSLKLGFDDERYWLGRLTGAPAIEKKTDVVRLVRAKFRTETAFAYATTAEFTTAGPIALSSVGGSEYVLPISASVLGNIYARPLITITVPVGGGSPYGISSLWITNTNYAVPPAFYVDRTYAAGDILTIDSETYAVKVNGTPVDFAGQFLVLDPREGATNDLEVHVIASSTPTLTARLDWTPRFSA